MHRKAVLCFVLFFKSVCSQTCSNIYHCGWKEDIYSFSSQFCLGIETFLCSLYPKRENRIRVSDLDIIYHFIVGHAQLLCKQIIMLSRRFPQGPICSPLTPGRKAQSSYNCCPLTTFPPPAPSTGLHPHKLQVSFFSASSCLLP